jgi:hypothetical protein
MLEYCRRGVSTLNMLKFQQHGSAGQCTNPYVAKKCISLLPWPLTAKRSFSNYANEGIPAHRCRTTYFKTRSKTPCTRFDGYSTTCTTGCKCLKSAHIIRLLSRPERQQKLDFQPPTTTVATSALSHLKLQTSYGGVVHGNNCHHFLEWACGLRPQ